MDLIRLGEKVISRRKIMNMVDTVIRLRRTGLSQTEVANRLGLDRTFVCRVENLGEIRKGKKIAVIGFPVQNKDEIALALEQEGVDFVLLMTEAERWGFVREKNGLDLFNEIMELLAHVQACDQTVVIGSVQRIKKVEEALDKEVLGYELGPSPLAEDKYVDPVEIINLVRSIKA